jgi:hypothetical protein
MARQLQPQDVIDSFPDSASKPWWTSIVVLGALGDIMATWVILGLALASPEPVPQEMWTSALKTTGFGALIIFGRFVARTVITARRKPKSAATRDDEGKN